MTLFTLEVDVHRQFTFYRYNDVRKIDLVCGGEGAKKVRKGDWARVTTYLHYNIRDNAKKFITCTRDSYERKA